MNKVKQNDLKELKDFLTQRLDISSQETKQVNQKLDNINQRLDKSSEEIKQVNQRITDFDSKITRLQDTLNEFIIDQKQHNGKVDGKFETLDITNKQVYDRKIRF